ncbi:MAG TPA: VanZ family protein [Burkholderiales bacterium]|jgi:VanZ family protein
MPIERLASLVFAVALLMAVLAGSPLPLPEPLDKAAHFTAYSLLTLFLWRATDMPLLAVASALLFGSLDEWRQAYIPGRDSDAQDFLADLCGVLATGGLLLMQRKTVCAES